jgi:hypothetical protein
MTTHLGPKGRQHGYASALRRFPQAEFAIRRLMGRSETFCDICEELADAEFALSKVPGAPPELAEARRVEWQELVDRLVAEVAGALRESEAMTRQARQIGTDETKEAGTWNRRS